MAKLCQALFLFFYIFILQKWQNFVLEVILVKMNIVQLENKLAKFDIFPTAREICAIIDMNEQAYSRKKKAETEIKQADIRKIEKQYCISLMDIPDLAEAALNKLDELFVEIPFFTNVYATCGDGGFVDENNFEMLTVPKRIIKGFSENYNYSVITARSSSMLPVIMPSDLLVIKHTNQIEDNKIHIFLMDNKLFCKYLFVNLDEILIKSANPEYKNMNVAANEIDVKGLVVGLIRHL